MSVTPHTTEAVDPRLAIVQDFAARVRRHDPAAEVRYQWESPDQLDIRVYTDRYLDNAATSAIAWEVYQTISDHPQYEINHYVGFTEEAASLPADYQRV